jgi:hypothetical protein
MLEPCLTLSVFADHRRTVHSSKSRASEMTRQMTTNATTDEITQFWKSLDRRGGWSTIFVREQAIRHLVDAHALESLLLEFAGNIRFVKTFVSTEGTSETFVLMSLAKKHFPHLHWPRRCSGPCKGDKSVHQFAPSAPWSIECGGKYAYNVDRLKRKGITTTVDQYR